MAEIKPHESNTLLTILQDMLDQSPMPINKDQISEIDPKYGSIKIILDQFRSIKTFIDQN